MTDPTSTPPAAGQQPDTGEPGSVMDLCRRVIQRHEGGQRCFECGDTGCGLLYWAQITVKGAGLSHPLT